MGNLKNLEFARFLTKIGWRAFCLILLRSRFWVRTMRSVQSFSPMIRLQVGQFLFFSKWEQQHSENVRWNWNIICQYDVESNCLKRHYISMDTHLHKECNCISRGKMSPTMVFCTCCISRDCPFDFVVEFVAVGFVAVGFVTNAATIETLLR